MNDISVEYVKNMIANYHRMHDEGLITGDMGRIEDFRDQDGKFSFTFPSDLKTPIVVSNGNIKEYVDLFEGIFSLEEVIKAEKVFIEKAKEILTEREQLILGIGVNESEADAAFDKLDAAGLLDDYEAFY